VVKKGCGFAKPLYYEHLFACSFSQAYQQYLDLKYNANYREDYGVEDELSATEEPFEASFTRLMDITRVITADEEQVQVGWWVFRDISYG